MDRAERFRILDELSDAKAQALAAPDEHKEVLLDFLDDALQALWSGDAEAFGTARAGLAMGLSALPNEK
jgi:hypothetical protein